MRGNEYEGSWAHQLSLLLRENARKASTKNKDVGYRTQEARHEALFLAFKQLREIGYKLDNPRGLREKHVKALVAKWESEGLSPSTLQNRLSHLRTLARWINKPNMIKSSESYVADPAKIKRKTATETDKGWAAKMGQEQIEEQLQQLEAFDPYVGLQLRFMGAFGARMSEAICFKPFKGDYGTSIELVDQTKGGQRRFVPIENDLQKGILAECKALAKFRNSSIGNPRYNLKQARDRFFYVMKKFGFTKKCLGMTSHGRRHDFLNDFYEKRAGMPSPVRGGGRPVKEVEDVARAQLSQASGHKRNSITSAYTGTYASRKPTNTSLTSERTERS